LDRTRVFRTANLGFWFTPAAIELNHRLHLKRVRLSAFIEMERETSSCWIENADVRGRRIADLADSSKTLSLPRPVLETLCRKPQDRRRMTPRIQDQQPGWGQTGIKSPPSYSLQMETAAGSLSIHPPAISLDTSCPPLAAAKPVAALLIASIAASS